MLEFPTLADLAFGRPIDGPLYGRCVVRFSAIFCFRSFNLGHYYVDVIRAVTRGRKCTKSITDRQVARPKSARAGNPAQARFGFGISLRWALAGQKIVPPNTNICHPIFILPMSRPQYTKKCITPNMSGRGECRYFPQYTRMSSENRWVFDGSFYGCCMVR